MRVDESISHLGRALPVGNRSRASGASFADALGNGSAAAEIARERALGFSETGIMGISRPIATAAHQAFGLQVTHRPFQQSSEKPMTVSAGEENAAVDVGIPLKDGDNVPIKTGNKLPIFSVSFHEMSGCDYNIYGNVQLKDTRYFDFDQQEFVSRGSFSASKSTDYKKRLRPPKILIRADRVSIEVNCELVKVNHEIIRDLNVTALYFGMNLRHILVMGKRLV
jgi:hypothetical protein